MRIVPKIAGMAKVDIMYVVISLYLVASQPVPRITENESRDMGARMREDSKLV